MEIKREGTQLTPIQLEKEAQPNLKGKTKEEKFCNFEEKVSSPTCKEGKTKIHAKRDIYNLEIHLYFKVVLKICKFGVKLVTTMREKFSTTKEVLEMEM